MTRVILAAFLVFQGLGALDAGGEDGLPPQDSTRSLAAALRERIDAYHQGQPANGEVLRLVYFYPRDLVPQAGSAERVERILQDVKLFYDSEMAALGFEGRVLPLDTHPDGSLRVHWVAGRADHTGYDYNTGDRVKRDIQAALDGEIDFSSDYVFVLSGLCEKRGELDYRVFAPYYGDGASDHRRGLCYAADCELLDPLNLKDAERTMKFSEHYGDYEMSVARFNSWYLGGIAHELGHGLSLPHNGEWPDQADAQGKALMGSGNHTYREEVYGEGKGSFMTLASGLRLAAHPLFTGSDRGRTTRLRCAIEALSFEPAASGVRMAGVLKSEPEALAVIAYVDPDGREGYDAKTWVGEVKDGEFALTIDRHERGPHELRLTVLHLNGAVSEVARLRYDAGPQPRVDAALLGAAWGLHSAEQAYMRGDTGAAAEQATQLLEADPVSPAAAKLRHLLALVDAEAPLTLASVDADEVSLSDTAWKQATVGWGKPARNQYYSGGNIRDAVFLQLGDQFFPKGLYAHAPSRYTFDLNDEWKQFEATVGLQAGAGDTARPVFIVKGDGEILHRSNPLKGRQTETVAVPVAGVRELELIVENDIDGNAGCWSIWGDPRVTR